MAVTLDATQRAGAVRSKGEQTRRAVLDAATARFGRDGYRSTSVADIAREAAVGGTVAYAYFASKEALFLAAVDEDAAGVIAEATDATDVAAVGWRQTLFFSLIAALERHPLARRLLAGLEPEVTDRVLEIPALADLRALCAAQLAAEQREGRARADVDPVAMANGFVAIMLSLLMSVTQLGDAAVVYVDDVAALLEAAVKPIGSPRRR